MGETEREEEVGIVCGPGQTGERKRRRAKVRCTEDVIAEFQGLVPVEEGFELGVGKIYRLDLVVTFW